MIKFFIKTEGVSLSTYRQSKSFLRMGVPHFLLPVKFCTHGRIGHLPYNIVVFAIG